MTGEKTPDVYYELWERPTEEHPEGVHFRGTPEEFKAFTMGIQDHMQRTIEGNQKMFRVDVANAEKVSMENHRRMKEVMREHSIDGFVFPERFVNALLQVVMDLGMLEYRIGISQTVRKPHQYVKELPPGPEGYVQRPSEERSATIGIKFEVFPTFEEPMTLTIREIPPHNAISRGTKVSNSFMCGLWVSLEDDTTGKICCRVLQNSGKDYGLPVQGDLEEGVSCE